MGVWERYSKEYRKPFAVKVGTVFESSHVKMHLWLQAIMLIAASKKGFTANQVPRTLGVTRETAWFMLHRIRLAMAANDGSLMGENGTIVDVEETISAASRASASRLRPQGVGLCPGRARQGRPELPYRRGQLQSVKSIMARNMAPEGVLNTDESKL